MSKHPKKLRRRRGRKGKREREGGRERERTRELLFAKRVISGKAAVINGVKCSNVIQLFHRKVFLRFCVISVYCHYSHNIIPNLSIFKNGMSHFLKHIVLMDKTTNTMLILLLF